MPEAAKTSTALLIGTSASVRMLVEQLNLLPEPPVVTGYVLLDRPTFWPLDAFHTPEALETVCAMQRPEMAVMSVPADKTAEALKIRTTLRHLSVPVRTVPPLDEMLASDVTGSSRAAGAEMNWSELIGRTPYGIDRRAVAGILEGKRVLITGAGGSIGSELARIVATFRPEQLILVERSENSLFDIDRMIGRRYPDVVRRAVLHDVVDETATQKMMAKYRPHVVFHAAAHKHVPLMEDHPGHAVTNNLFGTRSIADASLACGVERFVMISSDKAVNPTSVMGATKRLAEMYVQALHRKTHAGGAAGTVFSMVRFGNVLGSACSVLPIWATQMAEGGPITVTDPRMTRYFMTIHEAASLVIQAAAIDERSQAASVFVLDMGEPVKILELARRFVFAQGFTPTLDGQIFEDSTAERPAMPIVLTGARPGEKLHEELAYAAEQLRPTPYAGINAWAGTLGDAFELATMVRELREARDSGDRERVVETIRAHVPEMKRPEPLVDAKPGVRQAA